MPRLRLPRHGELLPDAAHGALRARGAGHKRGRGGSVWVVAAHDHPPDDRVLLVDAGLTRVVAGGRGTTARQSQREKDSLEHRKLLLWNGATCAGLGRE